MAAITLADLRRHAVARTLFRPTTLFRAIERLGFVQADPIRAPARAQDLTLRHRVAGYRAGDLERRYPRLPIEEDFFIKYGFLPRSTQALMHPRTARTVWTEARWTEAREVLAFVREHGVVHPRDVDLRFAHGTVKNGFGGDTNASTQLLDGMHYRGLVRIAGRSGGVRLYAAAGLAKGPDNAGVANTAGSPGSTAMIGEHAARSDADPGHAATVLDKLVDVLLASYAPLAEPSFRALVSHLRLAVPQWADGRRPAFARARARLPSAVVDGVRWYWPAGENPASRRHAFDDDVRLPAPFDPLVWDRPRFEQFWEWAYRFEAYTPAPKRLRGYYALPLLWRGQVIGWGNIGWRHPSLQADFGYVAAPPPSGAYTAALDDELQRMTHFLQTTAA